MKKTELLRLPRLPGNPSELHMTIASLSPQWVGSKPGTYARGTRSACLMLEIPCASCGAPVQLALYEVRKKVARGNTAVYCSLGCHAHANKRKCANPDCQNKIADSGRARMAQYCSPECRWACASRRYLADVQCPVCETMFRPTSHRTMYCSRGCANEAHSQRMLGAGNSHFKDGTSYALWFRSMRPLILDRDRVCVCCGSDSLLVVHHINHVPWDNTPGNLVVMCRVCHQAHHHSNSTPFPELAARAMEQNGCMTSKWHEQVASLQARFSPTTAE